ncbi:hypothetical protein FG379_001979 [Cryptosporidium bovis]|uniref:uncharacterized protein n=1 Tax=Cryptosporidium bovis TaxID=310047 RepID=UPI00351A2F09|nr:hypothetical protein FG379_001979 [Cryptosporidium bovis]
MVLEDVSSLVKEIKNEYIDILTENEGLQDYSNEKIDEIDLILSSKQVEQCLLIRDVVSGLLDFDIFCLNWENIDESVKTMSSNWNTKINSITFITQEPLIDVFGDIMTALKKIEEIGVSIANINIFLPYSSEIHVEYTKIMGMLEYEYNNRSITNFDFDNIKEFINMEQKGKTAIKIKELNLKNIFYCDGSELFNNKVISSMCTCTEYTELLNPILVSDLDDIYNEINIERRINSKYVMPKLFSIDNVKKNINLLNIDNLPHELKLRHSKHVLKIITFIFQEFNNVSLSKVNINLLSVGPSSKIVSNTFYNSYHEILRNMKNFCVENEKESDSTEITILFMDRSMDLISPIYSPIKNMNISDEGIFTRFDDGIIDYMDELMNKNLEYFREENGSGSDSYKKNDAPEDSYEKQMEQITNPMYLSIMLDPDKLQKDFLLSENYPVLSYKFISSLEDLEILLRSGEREFTYAKKQSIISKIKSLFKINNKLFGSNSWLYILSKIKQSNYTKLFWNRLLDIQYNIDSLKISKKRGLFLNTIKKYLHYIYYNEIINDNIIDVKNDLLIADDCDDISEECDIIKEIINLLLDIRTKLLPDSVTNILVKFENYDKSVFENELDNLSTDATLFLGILHIFLLQIFPVEKIDSYNSIFVKDIKKKFTTSSFENILTSNNVYCSDKNDCYNKILSLAISCSSYEGPDCKLSHCSTSNTSSNGKIKLKLNDIRNSRSILKNKEYRNFQLSSLLPKKDNYSQEFSTLISQILLNLITTSKDECNLQDHDDFLLSDLNITRIKNSNNSCNKTIIINIIGNVSIYEVLEIEKLASFLKKENNNQEYNIIVLTDQLFSSVAFNGYFLS